MSEQKTIGALQEEIARLQKQEREYLSEPQRRDREKRREQILGRWSMKQICTGDYPIPIPPPDVSGDEAWLFSDEALQADGYVRVSDGKGGTVWHRA